MIEPRRRGSGVICLVLLLLGVAVAPVVHAWLHGGGAGAVAGAAADDCAVCRFAAMPVPPAPPSRLLDPAPAQSERAVRPAAAAPTSASEAWLTPPTRAPPA